MCMYVCTYVGMMSVWLAGWLAGCMYAWMYVCSMYVCMHVCVYTCVYGCTCVYVYMHACKHTTLGSHVYKAGLVQPAHISVCIYTCFYICMYVCMLPQQKNPHKLPCNRQAMASARKGVFDKSHLAPNEDGSMGVVYQITSLIP